MSSVMEVEEEILMICMRQGCKLGHEAGPIGKKWRNEYKYCNKKWHWKVRCGDVRRLVSGCTAQRTLRMGRDGTKADIDMV